MKPPPFNYFDPRSIDEALGLLAAKPNAKLLAGGQSLMPMMNMRYVRPDNIIDLNHISELSYIREDGDDICIGSMARQRELEFSDLIQRRCPLMHEALLNVGHRQTRNRGTIGGSLCHLDPAAELPSVAMAYDAVIEVRGQAGMRSVAMARFPALYMTPAIEPTEIVVGVRFAAWPAGHGSAFLEFSRRHGDFAMVAVAALVDVGVDRTVRRASVTVSGLGFAPQRVAAAETILMGSDASADIAHRAADACGELNATSDVHASREYRQYLAATLAFRAICQACGRTRVAGGGARP